MTPDRFMSVAMATMACALAAGCAAPPSEGGAALAGANQSDCFSVRSVTGFNEVDRTTVRVNIGQHRSYDVHVVATCQELDWTDRIALTARSGNFLCVGRGFGQGEVRTRGDRCTIVDITHSPRPPEPGEEAPAES